MRSARRHAHPAQERVALAVGQAGRRLGCDEQRRPGSTGGPEMRAVVEGVVQPCERAVLAGPGVDGVQLPVAADAPSGSDWSPAVGARLALGGAWSGPKVRYGSGSGMPRALGRYSFAFSSLPEHQTSSKCSARTRRWRPACSERKWTMPSTVTHVPGGRAAPGPAGEPPRGKPKSEITPSMSTRSAGISLFAGRFVTIDTRPSALGGARVTHLDPRNVTRQRRRVDVTHIDRLAAPGSSPRTSTRT